MAQATTAQTVTQMLNQQVANWSILYIKLHNYHWYVKGEGFYELHEKFEEFYNEASGYIDEIAERILALNGQPVATMRDMLQTATLTEATGNENADQMVQSIINDFTAIVNECKEAVKIAENEDDDPSADMMIHIRTSLEKHVWMLNSLLSK